MGQERAREAAASGAERFDRRRVATPGGTPLPEVTYVPATRETPARLEGNNLATVLLNDVLDGGFSGTSLTQGGLRDWISRLDSAIQGHGRKTWEFPWT